ncbi:MAG: hypothetical protein IJ188_08465 [Clostridia bacterium]|nr:hypothetical protein [Clostridia bacterium]
MRSALVFNFLIEANIMASIAILLMIPLRKLLRKQIGNTWMPFDQGADVSTIFDVAVYAHDGSICGYRIAVPVG